MKKVIFISSTGGHLTELLQMKPLFDEVQSVVITEKTKSNALLHRELNCPVYYLVYGTKQHLFAYVFKFAWNWMKSLWLYVLVKPDVVITTGTHTAVPMCFIAHFFKKKVIWIETFANSQSATKAGKMIYPIADTFIVQWETMLQHYPKAIVGGWIF